MATLRRLVEGVGSGNLTTAELEEYTGLSPRHVRYYVLAAQTLGWLLEEESAPKLTDNGRQLLRYGEGSLNEAIEIAAAVGSSTIILNVAGKYLSQKRINIDQLTRRICNRSDLSTATARRRASCLLSWRTQLLERGWTPKLMQMSLLKPSTNMLPALDELSVRARNVVESLQVSELDKLAALTHDDLLSTPNCGRKTAGEILSWLAAQTTRQGATTPLQNLSRHELSVRAQHILEQLEVDTLEELVGTSHEDLLAVRNCGSKTAKEIAGWAKLQESAVAPETTSSAKRWSIDSVEEMPLELLLEVSILPLSTRAHRYLESQNVRWIGDLVTVSAATLQKGKRCGRKSTKEIRDGVELLGLRLGMSIPFWSAILPGDLASKNSAPLNRLREALQQTVFGVDSNSTVCIETTSILKGVATESQRIIIEDWMGLWSECAPTLEEVGKRHSVTRERVRQVVAKAQQRVDSRGLSVIRLKQAIETLERLSVASTSFAKSTLVHEGLVSEELSIVSLIRLASFFGLETGLEQLEVQGVELIGTKTGIEDAHRAVRYSRKAIRSSGCTTIDDVAAESAEGRELSTELVQTILESLEGFQWLDKPTGWFWLTNVKRNRLLNRLDKVLATAPRVELSALRSGIARFRRMEGFCPPMRVLRAICELLPDCNVVGDNVEDRRPRSRETELSEVELTMLSVFEHHGPVLSYSEARKYCIEAGINEHTTTIYLGGCAVVRRLVPGVYIQMGASASPGDVEAVVSTIRRGRQQRVQQDYGWNHDGSALWVTYKISGGLLRSGVANIPATIQRFVGERSFDLIGTTGKQVGTLQIRGAQLQGLAHFFRRRGGDEGDHLRVAFNLAENTAVIELSEESFEDDA